MCGYTRLKLPTFGECIDVALRLRLIERVLGLNLRYQFILIL
jgi:hypothetical protein